MTNSADKSAADQSSTRGAYPYYGLSKSLDVASVVRDLGGNKAPVQRGLIASHLELEDNSTSLSQMIGAAKCFGLIDGRSTYLLTDLAKEFFYPTDPKQKHSAVLRAVASPLVFKQLIERFDGSKLPPNDMLAHLLHREFHVTESWRVRVASMFASCLREAGVLDDAGIIRYSVRLNGNLMLTPRDTVINHVDPPQRHPHVPGDLPAAGGAATHPERKLEPADDINVWVYGPKGSGVRVETSAKLTMQVWRKLEQYIQVLKPAEGEG